MIQLLFNLVEGFWWTGLGTWLFFSGSLGHKYYNVSIAITLILFGISDFVEMVTGAWWRPWWLLVWKVVFLGVGLVLIILIYKAERR